MKNNKQLLIKGLFLFLTMMIISDVHGQRRLNKKHNCSEQCQIFAKNSSNKEKTPGQKETETIRSSKTQSMGCVQPNTNPALPEAYNFQEYVFPEPDDQGICLGIPNSTAVIEDIFLAQTHRHAIGHPFLFTIGKRPALFQIAVTGSGPAPDVQVTGTVNGTTLGTLCLNGPANLSTTIDMTQPNFSDYFSVTLPKSWINVGLELSVTAGGETRILTQNDLNVRPYTEMNLVLLNLDMLDYNNGPHLTPIFETFLQEVASAIPASVIRFGKLPETLKIPSLAVANNEGETVIVDSNEMLEDNGLNGGYINAMGQDIISSIHRSTGDFANTIYFGNTLNLNPGGWGGDGNFVSADYTGVFIHELGHALSLPHWEDEFQLNLPEPDQCNYPYAGETGDAGGRGESWNFIQHMYEFVSPYCEELGSPLGSERSDCMQREISCLETRSNGPGPWDGFGDFSAMAMNDYLLGSVSTFGEVEYRGEMIDFHFKWNHGYPKVDLVNGQRIFTREATQPQNTFAEDQFKLPGQESVEQDVFLIYGSAHATNPAANIIYEPIKYKGTLLPTIDPTDPAMFSVLQNIDDTDAPELYDEFRDITLKLTYADGSLKHVLVPFKTFDRADPNDPNGGLNPVHFSVVVSGEESLCNVEMYHRDFLISDDNNEESGNINDPLQNITAANFMNDATLMSVLDYSCNCPGTPGYVEPGTPCDDGNALTNNDVEDGFCNCEGQPIAQCGLITNSEFMESMAGWRFWALDAASINGEAALQNIIFGEGGMAQDPLTFNTNETYEISFDAYADDARSMEVVVFEEINLVYTEYFRQTINLTTTKQNFEMSFLFDQAATNLGTLEFDFSSSEEDIFLDNICMDVVCAGQIEIPYNGIDDDCDPATLDDDIDQDGFNLTDDCNDNNPNINPNATDIPDNGIDEDCDGTDSSAFVDNDNDGFNNDVDCDDNNAQVNPDAAEVPYNGIDDDCNVATLDDDLDQDGFVLADDCDDTDANINPDATEVPYNSIDDDCNAATLDDDLDQDGFVLADDCDDTDANINPDATEVPYNGIDDDCNAATLDDDLDQDGFVLADDCDDTNADVNPDATEVPYNGIDDDCNAATQDDDLDQDGFLLADDCDDTNADVNPDATEVPYNGIDEDCDGIDSQVLPLDFLDFYGEVVDESINLTWEVANEVNVDRYIIQRSNDQVVMDFNELGEVSAEGLSEYSFVDENSVVGTNYYRILAVDLNGLESYSEIISIFYEEISSTKEEILKSIILSPNPVSHMLQLSSGELVQIVDLNGRTYAGTLDVSCLANGIYAAIIKVDNKVLIKRKFVKI